MGVGSGIAGLWKLARSVEGLFEAQAKHGEVIGKLTDRIASLERDVANLKVREEVLIARCEGQAAAAATAASAIAMSDLARRVGGMEERGRAALEGPKTGPALRHQSDAGS